MAGIKALIGDEVQDKSGKMCPVEEICAGKKAVGIYFSAHWCPPCRGFTPVLAEFYKENDGDCVIIFVSSDRDQASFDEYFGEMPWYALPFAKRDVKESVSQKYGVRGIPTLVVLRPDGTTIEENGRGSVANSNGKFPQNWC
ncbi:uncharacterized protein LOC132728325 [Ruditapes philippinarum]|uniref:uncharacterized protein LOC132728325 n=1 Tax=Ruditapes philippinarum TaxID=129788 RepID=UPI00295B9890|nr:uncharacterized protein LOC132728325 [Ruditapes philippinarum]